LVDDESIDDIHVALLALTGNPVMGVFHTLLAGKAGQCVPGRRWPDVRALCSVAEFAPRDTALANTEGTVSAANTTRAAAAHTDPWRSAL
jgi:hypothetical protein